MTDDAAQAGGPGDAGAQGAALLQYSRRRLKDEFLQRLLRCLEELSDEELWWRPNDDANSVGNLVLHLAGNVGQWINSGMGGSPDHRDRKAEFSERGPVPRQELVERISAVIEGADDVLARFDPSRLMEKRRIQIYDVTCLEAVTHVVEHFSMHLGQIIYVTKLKKGIDLKFYNL